MATSTLPRPRLLTEQELAEAGPAEAVRLPLELIDQNPRNPRQTLVEIDQLAESIADPDIGLLQPVTVRRAGERYELVGGHRRYAAFALLRERFAHDPKWHTIPAVVRSATDEQADRMLISGQVHIRAWRPREEAAALERLMVAGSSVTDIGTMLHKSAAWASKRLRVYTDAVLSGLVQTGKLSTGVAEELLLIRDPETRKEFAERAVSEKWSQDQARGRTRSLRLDRQQAQIGKLARDLVNVLSVISPQEVPIEVQRDLLVLRGRIDVLSGRPVRTPSIAEAERAAGIKSQVKPLKRGERRKPGYKPRV